MQIKPYIFLFLGIILTSGVFVFSGKLINSFSDKNLALLAEIPLNHDSSISIIDNQSPKTENNPKKISAKKSIKKEVIPNKKTEDVPKDADASKIIQLPIAQSQNSYSGSIAINKTENQIDQVPAPQEVAATTPAPVTSDNIINQESAVSSSSINQITPTSSPISNISHVVISEIQLTGGSGKTVNDFIEIWNPSSSEVDLSGWKLRKRTKSGSESSIRVFPDGSKILGNGFFLWANSDNDFANSINADVSSTASISGDSSVALLNSNDEIIDSVAWGSDLIDPFSEGESINIDLEANQSFERKSWTDSGCSSSSGTYELRGNGCDNNSNKQDFELRTVSNPQNSKSSIES